MDWILESCIVIPCHNEFRTITSLVLAAKRHLPYVIVVDDGSSDQTASAALLAGANVLRHPACRGKGASLETGIRHAHSLGFAWALLMDGDGQHSPEDIPVFLNHAEREPADMLAGNRMNNLRTMPVLRRWANRTMSRILSRATGADLPDSQCGFRLVRIPSWRAAGITAEHFEIESESLLRFVQHGFSIRFIPIQTIYAAQRSRIRIVRDTIRWIAWWRKMRANPRPANPRSSPVPAST